MALCELPLLLTGEFLCMGGPPILVELPSGNGRAEPTLLPYDSPPALTKRTCCLHMSPAYASMRTPSLPASFVLYASASSPELFSRSNRPMPV